MLYLIVLIILIVLIVLIVLIILHLYLYFSLLFELWKFVGSLM